MHHHWNSSDPDIGLVATIGKISGSNPPGRLRWIAHGSHWPDAESDHKISIGINDRSPATGANGMAWLVIASACVACLWFRLEIILTAWLVALLMIGMYIVAVHLYCTGHLRGRHWRIYLTGMLFGATGTIFVISAASTPAHAPPSFPQWQAWVHEYGIRVFWYLFKSGQVTSSDVLWFVCYALGIMALLSVLKDIILSLFFCIKVSKSQLLDGGGTPSRFVRASADNFLRPWRTLTGLLARLLFAYGLVIGQLSIWFMQVWQELPIVEKDLMQRFVWGAAGH